jgi:large subunit ribosomal protein L6
MSRVGKKPIEILAGVKVDYTNRQVTVQGPQGSIKQMLHPVLDLKLENNIITVTRNSEKQLDRAVHGLYRTLIANMVIGAKNGFAKKLVIEGIGFRREIMGKTAVFELGFSHPIVLRIPDGIKITLEDPNKVIVSGVDKQLVGEVAATIRQFRPPEPYKGKGIRYENEQIRRKAGKTATSEGEK